MVHLQTLLTRWFSLSWLLKLVHVNRTKRQDAAWERIDQAVVGTAPFEDIVCTYELEPSVSLTQRLNDARRFLNNALGQRALPQDDQTLLVWLEVFPVDGSAPTTNYWNMDRITLWNTGIEHVVECLESFALDQRVRIGLAPWALMLDQIQSALQES